MREGPVQGGAEGSVALAPTSCLLLSSFSWAPLVFRPSGIHPDSWPRAVMVGLGGAEGHGWAGSGHSAAGVRAAPVFRVTSLLLVSLCRCPQLPFPTGDMGCASAPGRAVGDVVSPTRSSCSRWFLAAHCLAQTPQAAQAAQAEQAARRAG